MRANEHLQRAYLDSLYSHLIADNATVFSWGSTKKPVTISSFGDLSLHSSTGSVNIASGIITVNSTGTSISGSVTGGVFVATNSVVTPKIYSNCAGTETFASADVNLLSDANSLLHLIRFGDTSTSTIPNIAFIRGRNTKNVISGVAINDCLGSIQFRGAKNDGLLTNSVGAIRCHAFEAFTTGSTATRLEFQTTTTGSASVSTKMVLDHDGTLRGLADDFNNLGSLVRRWKEIFCTNGVINTSDRRQKRNIQKNTLGLAFIKDLIACSYSWNDTIINEEVIEVKVKKPKFREIDEFGYEILEESGKHINRLVKRRKQIPVFKTVDVYNEQNIIIGKIEVQEYDEILEKQVIQPGHFKANTRTHYGMIAQRVRDVCIMHNIDPNNFAPLIYDKDADRWGLRYDQFIAILITGVQELTERVEKLEGKVNIFTKFKDWFFSFLGKKDLDNSGLPDEVE